MVSPVHVAIAGDWHVDEEWALKMLELIAEQHHDVEHVLHVGDFGFYFDKRGLHYLAALNDACEHQDLTLKVTEGNHEEYPFIRHDFNQVTDDGFLFHPDYPRIHLAPRGHRWEYGGFTFLSMGGANSINRGSLARDIDWWADEQISLADMYRTRDAAFTSPSGKIDVMITHDCPSAVPIIEGGERWPAEDVVYSMQSRLNVQMVVADVKPRVLFHGHHHTYHDSTVKLSDDNTQQRVVGLDMNGRKNNVAILDVETLDYFLI